MGTRIVRRIPVTMGDKPGTTRLSWNGIPSAQAAVYVVEDMKDVDVEDLDLAATRVLLFTNFGNMEVSFFPDKAPRHVKNFIQLSKSGFFDGTRFHRIIKGFMIQGGDPNTKDDDPANDGMGTPGYTVDAEFNDTVHDKGILSMARSGDPNSAGSQFFIVHGRAAHLDGQYTAFGKLEKGLDVLDRITDVPTEPTGERSRPTQDVRLEKALVLGVRKQK
jgi:peptidyl-prolyl cis-trans isomerase B (cyclophilin B)